LVPFQEKKKRQGQTEEKDYREKRLVSTKEEGGGKVQRGHDEREIIGRTKEGRPLNHSLSEDEKRSERREKRPRGSKEGVKIFVLPTPGNKGGVSPRESMGEKKSVKILNGKKVKVSRYYFGVGGENESLGG